MCVQLLMIATFYQIITDLHSHGQRHVKVAHLNGVFAIIALNGYNLDF